ncbi:hypothetical protein SARC_08908 [Sphaeroforma arctica JP610]|uniref:Uncharacterized protein n=1 Tax=Sphaeroforma arctica JP610 TaxID=667725 RepID=A0A0L0FQ69_9EUKA|nr:hypothetical protein SARC_08908 [Sphaeroforma arctica JP610]KNC78671.1 hypothetical protein SARC_08908 [Sphaeroforma arctica JP610]|eukprot:XP_014152573.1 hypothetical protein SARC_08908 [Sphaeroforma arctica JP610]
MSPTAASGFYLAAADATPRHLADWTQYQHDTRNIKFLSNQRSQWYPNGKRAIQLDTLGSYDISND